MPLGLSDTIPDAAFSTTPGLSIADLPLLTTSVDPPSILTNMSCGLSGLSSGLGPIAGLDLPLRLSTTMCLMPLAFLCTSTDRASKDAADSPLALTLTTSSSLALINAGSVASNSAELCPLISSGNTFKSNSERTTFGSLLTFLTTAGASAFLTGCAASIVDFDTSGSSPRISLFILAVWAASEPA